MSKTSIEWTDFSVNPIRARHRQTGAVGHYCELVSSGCANCYASALQKRFRMPPFPGQGRLDKLPVVDDRGCVQVSEELELFFDQSKLDEVLKRRKPTKWFWCDMTDLFGAWVPDMWIDLCFATMAKSPQHTHQVLTKRAQRMQSYVAATERAGRIQLAAWDIVTDGSVLKGAWPLPNVWSGVSAENQRAADERIPWLLKTPAAVRFVSAEPLLGPIELDRWLVEQGPGWRYADDNDASGVPGIDWLIVGGESGHGARPMHPDWARSLRDQCQAAGVPFFFKQWGEWHSGSGFSASDRDKARQGFICPGGCFSDRVTNDALEQHSKRCTASIIGSAATPMAVYRLGKAAAGRLLDGREWSEFPETGHV